MTAEERQKLHNLYRDAMNYVARAGAGGVQWSEAFAADDAFLQALYAIKLSKETP